MYTALPLKQQYERIVAAAQRIKSSSHAALCKAGHDPASHIACSSTRPAITSPTICLPFPEQIDSILLNMGCSFDSANQLSNAFARAATEIRTAYESTHKQTCRRLIQNLRSDPTKLASQLRKLTLVLEAQYYDRVEAAKRAIMGRVRDLHQSQPSSGKRTFNYEFVPLLETYFEHNSYPSAADRSTLARKSMMTPRQIEVWFQNHRSRAKKEGQRLRRLDPDAKILNLSLESLEKKMPSFVVPKSERNVECVINEITDESDNDLGVQGKQLEEPGLELKSGISMIAPSHAFPSIFPPSCNQALFPKEPEKYTFTSPIWRRRPATSPPYRLAIDLEEFIEDFRTKLIVCDLSLKKQHFRESCSASPWFAATRIVVPHAPLPALIRLTSPPKGSDSRSLPVVPALSLEHLCRSSNPFSQFATLRTTPLHCTPVQRKLAGLPRRVPKHASISHHQLDPGVNAACSNFSSPSPASPQTDSRVSSLESCSQISSSDRRCPSSSSLSSSSSHESLVLTPAVTTTLLPDHSSVTSKSTPLFGVDSVFDDDDTLSLFEDHIPGCGTGTRL